MRYGSDYIKVNLGFDVEPHTHIPTVWRINGGSYCLGNANDARMRDSLYRFNYVFIDSIFASAFDSGESDDDIDIFVRFLFKFFNTYFHEYIHHFIPLEFVGHEKTKVDPITENILLSYTQLPEWSSWCKLFEDVIDFIPVFREERRKQLEEFKLTLQRHNSLRTET